MTISCFGELMEGTQNAKLISLKYKSRCMTWKQKHALVVMQHAGAPVWWSYWWCSCGRVPEGWTPPGCRGRRWRGRWSHTCRKIGRWFRWCCRKSLSRRPSLWKPCSTPPVARCPTPASSCRTLAPPPTCSPEDMGLAEKEGWRGTN